MVVKFIEIFLEYLAIVLCMHKIARKEFIFNKWFIVFGLLIEIVLLLITGGMISKVWKTVIYICLFWYAKGNISEVWSKAVSITGAACILVIAFQLLIYLVLMGCNINFIDMEYGVVGINLIIVAVIREWKEKYRKVIVNKINKGKMAIVLFLFVLILIRILLLFNKNSYLDFEVGVQFLIETVGLTIAAMLWLDAENEKEHKIKELQMYEMYNHAFEGAIHTIRVRQHEFENHINAIKCLQYTIKNQSELLEAQNKYCDMLLQDDEITKLLRIDFEPVVIGFIYSKIIEAKEKGISVKYEIHVIDIRKVIPVHEFIEILGILLDNAIEALIENNRDKIILKIIPKWKNGFSVEVSNVSPILSNGEIEKFCLDGYSTKGKDRGIGLTRVKEIAVRRNAQLLIGNKEYKNDNYLFFRIDFVYDIN